MKKQVLFLMFCLLTASVKGQVPITHLYSFQWTGQGDSLAVGASKLWSGTNLNGYNNQPYFLGDEEMALTLSWHIDATTDLYLLNFQDQDLRAITNTREAEYSPKKMGDHWFCVRVDTMGRQHLWAYPIDGSNRGHNVLPGVDNVGYFEPLGKDSAVVFLTGEPHQLAVFNLKNGKSYKFSSNICRTYQVRDEGVYYIHKTTAEAWYLKMYDPKIRKSRIVGRAMDGVEDFTFHNGYLLAAKGSKLYRYRLGGKSWDAILDLSPWKLKNITRIVTNDKYLVCVEKVE